MAVSTIHAPTAMRSSGHSAPQSISGRFRPSVRVAKNHRPMTRMIAPTISETLRPLSDGGGRQAGVVRGGGALAPHAGDGGGVAGGSAGGGVAGDGLVDAGGVGGGGGEVGPGLCG